MPDNDKREWVINADDPGGDLKVGMRLRLTAFPAFDGSDDYEQEPYFNGEGTIAAISPRSDGVPGKTFRVTDINWKQRPPTR